MKQLRRMLDVTKATLLFARGVVLVEGISEALLVPVLASRLEPVVNLAGAGVSVVPMAGVAFATIAKLFGEDRLTMPVAIVTDADPSVTKEDDVESPKSSGDGFEVCDRVVKLKAQFVENTQVAVFHSQVTLEYDLAEAALSNAGVIFGAWESCYVRKPKALDRASLDAAPTPRQKALLLWRAVCRGDPTHGKAALAQALAGMLEEVEAGKQKVPVFVVPKYLENALRHVVRRRDETAVSTETTA